MFLSLVVIRLSSHIPTALIKGRPVLEITYTLKEVSKFGSCIKGDKDVLSTGREDCQLAGA